MKTALLISTYNWPEALRVIFKSILNQTVFPDEVIVADDGSKKSTTILIKAFKYLFPNPVTHVWQEDKGFRKSKILNRAIARSSADYIIQVDGDCILHKNFIEDHINNIHPNTYLFGSRVNILPAHVKETIDRQIIDFTIFSPRIKNKGRTLRFPLLSRLYKRELQVSKKVRGCNLSFWKKDFLEINGYNEAFEGWGREDSELVWRLNNNGVSGKRLKFCGIVFHIHHTVQSRQSVMQNNTIEKQSVENKITYIENGVDKYLKESGQIAG